MSNIIRREPFSRALSLREAMNRIFEEGFLRPFERWPLLELGMEMLALDVLEEEDRLVIEASLPGIKPDDVDISVTGNTLTIRGESRQETERKSAKYYYRERGFGSVQRTVTLPVDVNTDAAEAIFENGVLKLTLPKVEGAKSRHIEVKGK